MRTFQLTLALVALTLLAAPFALADAPSLLPVQGTLYDAAGEPIEATYSVEFTLYADAAGETSLWTDTFDVEFIDGTFTAYLGESSPINQVIFRDYGEVYVGMAIDGDEEMPLFALATAPYAAYATYSGDAETLGGQSADDIVGDALTGARAEFSPLGHRTGWEDLDDVPEGFDDGVDDDTNLSESEVDAYVANNGFVTAVAAGAGLTGGGTGGDVSVAADPTWVQRRVTGSCSAGETISRIYQDGTVDCEADDVGTGDITGVSVAPGILGGGTEGAVTISPDPTWLQRRVIGSCPAGQSIRQILQDGSVECEDDTVGTGDITEVAAGAGLSGGATSDRATLSIDSSYTQRRVSGTCPPGSAISTINANGTVSCQPVILIACDRTGWVYGDQGCNDDILITCTGGFVTSIDFAC